MKRRLLSVAMVLCLALNLLPMEAFAADGTEFTEPQVTKLTVSFDGGEPVELLGDQPTVTMPEGAKPVFTVSFDSTDLLNQVYVTSTKDGETKYLEATFQSDQYITDGYFDPSDTNYIPGTIAVTYSKKSVAVTDSNTIGDIDLESLKSQLEASGIELVNNVIGDGSVEARIAVDMGAAAEKVYLDAAISQLNAGAGVDEEQLKNWLGIEQELSTLTSIGLNGADGPYEVFLEYIGKKTEALGDDAISNFLVILRDISGNKYTKMVIQAADKDLDLDDISDTLSGVNTLSSALYDYYTIHKDMDKLRDEVNSSTMSAEEKVVAAGKIDDLENDKKWFMIATTALPLIVGVAAGGAPALLFSALLGSIKATSDYFWDHRIGMIQGCDPIDGVFSADDDHGTKLVGNDYAYTITQSGKYYCTENDRAISIGNADGSGSPIDVTLCLHGVNVTTIRMNNNSMLHICDCKFTENSDGSFAGGQITAGIYCGEGTVIIEEGIVRDSIELESNSTLIINGGYFHNSGTSMDDVVNDGGQVTINGGILEGSGRYAVDNQNGGITEIAGGTVASVYNQENSEVTITGGTVQDLLNYGTATVNGGLIADDGNDAISNEETGKLYIRRGTVQGKIYNDGTMEMTGGTVKYSTEGIANRNKLTVRGGTFESAADAEYGAIAIANGGELVITGGKINAAIGYGIKNGDEIRMSGGTIIAELEGIRDNCGSITISDEVSIYGQHYGIYTWAGTVTVSGGKIEGEYEGAYYTQNGGKVTLLFKSDSAIELVGRIPYEEFFPDIQADPSYQGGVVCYYAPDAEGVQMTLQEAASIPFDLHSYVRLTADGITGRPSTGEEPDDCEHSYSSTVIAPTCTDRGYTTYACDKCGGSYRDNYTDALGHSFGAWTITTPATATANGSQERICSRCGIKETQVIPARGGSSSGTSSDDDDNSTSSSSSNTTTQTTRNPDGSTTTTVTDKKTGTVTKTTKNKDGSTLTVETKKGGTVTTTETMKNGVQIKSVNHPGEYVTAKVTIPENIGKATITIPTNVTPGTVAKNADTGEIIKLSVPIEDGMAVPLDNSANLVLVDMSKDFPDTHNHWAKDGIDFVTARGMFSGYGDGTFVPDGTMTRGMIAVVLHNFTGNPECTFTGSFEDVADGSWYADGIYWLVDNGIAGGYDNGKYGANDNITREQLATFLYRYANVMGYDISGGNDLSGYADASKISSYATEAMSWAVGNKLLSGYGNGNLGPQNTATRAQVATILMRFCKAVVK